MRKWDFITAGLLLLLATGCDQTPPIETLEQLADAPAEDSLELPPQSEPPVENEFEEAPIEQPLPPASDASLFQRLSAAYASGDQETWTRLRQELSAAGASAIPELVAVLRDGALHERELALDSLKELPQTEATIKAFCDALRDESVYVRAGAAMALSQTAADPPELLEVLRNLLEQPEARWQTVAAAAAGRLGKRATSLQEPLQALLETEDPGLRAAAAAALKAIEVD